MKSCCGSDQCCGLSCSEADAPSQGAVTEPSPAAETPPLSATVEEAEASDASSSSSALPKPGAEGGPTSDEARDRPEQLAASPRGRDRRERAKVSTVLVRFRVPGQAKEFAAGELELPVNSEVIVEAEYGTRVGCVMAKGTRPAGSEPGSRILRVLNEEDQDLHTRNRTREREAFAFCVERIRALSLPMKLVSVEFAHSGSSAVFHFSAADRVDFRALVKDLARRFHTRIEMRQIGVRDASRFTGGTGVCGRELCCAMWLRDFNPISVRMAKDQNLALNHEKLSGVCGRLKCCLAYEQPTYEDQRKGLPKLGKRVLTPEGEARVKDVNVLKRLVRVQFPDGRYAEFPGDKVKRPADLSPQGAQERGATAEPSSAAGGTAGDRGVKRAGDPRSGSPLAPSARPPRGDIRTDARSNPRGDPRGEREPEQSQADGQDPQSQVGGKRRRRRRRRGRRGKGSGPEGQGSQGTAGGSGARTEGAGGSGARAAPGGSNPPATGKPGS